MPKSSNHGIVGKLPQVSMNDSFLTRKPLLTTRVDSNINRSVPMESPLFGDDCKRRFHLVTSLLILLFTNPIILTTMLLIWLSTFGKQPVFYRQLRVGLNGSLFSILKFRSMNMDAEKDGAQMAKRNDARVTRIGRIIRIIHIDELPQLFNVLHGEMSLIGPRPERPEFVFLFEQQIKGYSLRNQVKPGITGWAQVHYPYGETVEDAANKLFYDLSYIRRNSLILDITILFHTIPIILTGYGAR